MSSSLECRSSFCLLRKLDGLGPLETELAVVTVFLLRLELRGGVSSAVFCGWLVWLRVLGVFGMSRLSFGNRSIIPCPYSSIGLGLYNLLCWGWLIDCDATRLEYLYLVRVMWYERLAITAELCIADANNINYNGYMLFEIWSVRTSVWQVYATFPPRFFKLSVSLKLLLISLVSS